MNSCVGGDVNGDRRADLVCTGAGGALRWYENKGAAAGATAGRLESDLPPKNTDPPRKPTTAAGLNG
jgi:hypothetical protein